MNPLRVLLIALALAAAAAGAYVLVAQSGDGVRPEMPSEPNATPPRAQPATPATATADDEIGDRQPASRRVAAGSDTSHAHAAQGIKGRVLLPDGQPAADVAVYLLDNLMNDPLRGVLRRRSGRASPPLAAGFTAGDGTFALGARRAGHAVDLRVASEDHPELTRHSIRVRSDDWYDTGDLTLAPGRTLGGRVIDEVRRTGIAGAAVYLTDSHQAHSLLPTPGRERGIAALTDAAGNFWIHSAPYQGHVNLVAEADGYAATTLLNQPLLPEGEPTFAIELAPGRPIAGVVVDSGGEPVPDIEVTAQGLSDKTPHTAIAVSDAVGRFEFPSLRDGPYELVTRDAGFTATRSPPVLTGDLAVKLVLTQRPWVKLRVRGAEGRPIRAYRISLKRHFPNNPLGIGNVPEFSDRSVTPADYRAHGDWAVIRGLPAGQFVFQIRERTHAKSLSEPFTVRIDHEPAEVEAILTLGATILGTVTDENGAPVRGAAISTDMNNALSGAGEFGDLLRELMPERHSRAQTHTDRDGRFRLSKLAFADYMLRASHADYCDGTVMDIGLSEAGQVVDVGTIRLARGTVVTGVATIAGEAAGQIKVSISTPPDTTTRPPVDSQPSRPRAAFSATAISDNSGRYRLPQRVPPGTYRVQAVRASGSGNPFDALRDIRETEKTVTVVSGQDRLDLNFNLSER